MNPHTQSERCGECGMQVGPLEYHPFAACLMYKQCANSTTVRRNLDAVVEHGRMLARLVGGVTSRPQDHP